MTDLNDRYLYRAKRKKWELFPEAQQWVQGYYVHTAESDYIVSPYEHTTLLGEGETVEIEVNTLCQCTGLKDKNGNLIWENDIIKCKCGIAVVVWDKSEWRIKWVKDTIWRKDLHFWVNDENESGVEVIGSAIDNPELLEVGE